MTDDKVLDELKQQFISRDKTEREKFFSAASPAAEFTNSQLFFFKFAQNRYRLHSDGEFDRLCADMEACLGKELYTELMADLTRLRDKKVQEIKNNASEFLTHISNISPREMGNTLTPKNNLNQFGEKRDNFVFATDSELERDFYALRINDKEGKNINWQKRANIDGKEKYVFIMEKINNDSYTYFVPKEKFSPVVCLDGRWDHEWTASEEVPYSACEKNDIEEIKNRNIIKIVDRDKFYSQDAEFYRKLNNPDLVLDTLDNSGVLNSSYQKISELKKRLGIQTDRKSLSNLSKNDSAVLKLYQNKRQNGKV